jgi:hypothetical protein
MNPFRFITLAVALTFGATACGGDADETQSGAVDTTSTVPAASIDIPSTTSTPDLEEQAGAEKTPIAWVLAGGYTSGITMDELVDLHWQTIAAATELVTPGR